MKKTIITSIITVILVLATMVTTFIATMNNLKIVANEEEGCVLVECFGQLWYCEAEKI